MKQLEQMLELAPQVQKNINRTIDVYASGTAALYTAPAMIPMGNIVPMVSTNFGLQNPEPFQYGYDLGGGLKCDFHGPNEDTLTYGHVKPMNGNSIIKEYNGYECSMLDPILKNNFNRFP
jgi:hypothetical protein